MKIRSLLTTAIIILGITPLFPLMASAGGDTGQNYCYGVDGTPIPCPEPGDPLFEQDANYITQTPAFQDMEDFIETVNNVALQKLLQEAIQGKGAFRRFRDALNDAPEQRERWFEFKDACIERRVHEWLAKHGIEPD